MKTEKTFVIIKPDGIQRSLIGEIISRFERIGLKLIAMKMILPTKEIIRNHYLLDPEWLRKTGEKAIANYIKKEITPPINDPSKVALKVLANLEKYMSSGPVIAMVWQGAHSVGVVRKLVGGTEPLTSDVGTIRGDFVLDSYQMSDLDERSIRNIIHASGSVEEANNEITLWFKNEDIVNYKQIQESILYDVNLDGILE
ncbi:MAG: nucleoside-diphosphate kinase [bacterium]